MIQPQTIFGRHGRTAGNEQNIYRGWSNDWFAVLDPKLGVQDAREEGLYLLNNVNLKFAAVFSDDLQRVIQTRDIVCDILGIHPGVRIIDKRLRPLNVGDYTGQSKETYPLTQYMNDPTMKIPGGESINGFNKRQAECWADIMEFVATKKQPVLTFGHGSNVSFLNRAFNHQSSGYEGLVNPGGLVLVTQQGIAPLFKKRENGANPFADGTPLAGFVTDEENRPPRECWNCRYFQRDMHGLGSCQNILVRIDKKLADRMQGDGSIAVGDRDCCNQFRNTISS